MHAEKISVDVKEHYKGRAGQRLAVHTDRQNNKKLGMVEEVKKLTTL